MGSAKLEPIGFQADEKMPTDNIEKAVNFVKRVSLLEAWKEFPTFYPTTFPLVTYPALSWGHQTWAWSTSPLRLTLFPQLNGVSTTMYCISANPASLA